MKARKFSLYLFVVFIHLNLVSRGLFREPELFVLKNAAALLREGYKRRAFEAPQHGGDFWEAPE